MNNNCINYNLSILDLIIPPYTVLFKLCEPRDKSKLFVISFIRTCILFYLTIYLYQNPIQNFINNNKNNNIPIILFIVMASYTFINLLITSIIIYKNTLYESNQYK